MQERMRSYSAQQQDLFAYNLVGKCGTFLDLGCWRPKHNNNTYLLESEGWSGLLFDLSVPDIEMCRQTRRSKSFCMDVKKPEFIGVLEKEWDSKHFDYVSLDVDEGSVEVLFAFLTAGYTFGCMTFEHDYYHLGNSLKLPATRILSMYGYECLFEDVVAFPTHCPMEMKKYPNGIKFEDWWIDPKKFHKDLLSLRDKDIPHSECIQKVEGRKWQLI